ncbi:MAG TPA: helix-turn-helix domain-containing protein [Rhodopila sp.]
MPSPAPDAASRTGFAQKETVLHFLADHEIYAEHDEAKTFYRVVSGMVRTCRFTHDGRRQIEAFHVAGDVFGLEHGTERLLSAEAVTDCAVISFHRQRAEMLATTDGDWARQLFAYAMQSAVRAQEHSLLLGRSGAAQKVATFLLEMAQRSGQRETTIDLAMTRQDIADYLGLTIETVSRTLSQLERDGMIARPTARRILVRNTSALRQLVA